MILDRDALRRDRAPDRVRLEPRRAQRHRADGDRLGPRAPALVRHVPQPGRRQHRPDPERSPDAAARPSGGASPSASSRTATSRATASSSRSSATRRPSRPAPRSSPSRPGAPMWVAAATRTKDGRYRGRVVHVPAPEAGSRRERVTAMTTSMVAAFEDLLGDAPEQWWGAFHPIWPDLAVGARPDAPARERAPVGGGRMTPSPSTAAAARTSTSTRSRPTAPRRSGRSWTTWRRQGSSTSSRSPTTSGSTRRSPRGRWPRTAGLAFEVVVGEEITTLGGHLVGAVPRGARPAAQEPPLVDRGDPRPGRDRDPGAPARPAPPVRAGLGPAAPARTTTMTAVHPDAIETFNPTAIGRYGHRRSVEFATRHGLPRIGSSDAHAVDGDRERLDDVPRPHARRTWWPRSAPGPRPITGRSMAPWASWARSGGSCASAAGTRAPRSAGRIRRDGTGRDHGYPGSTRRPPVFEPGRDLAGEDTAL